jgi:hypothetical protein
MREAVKMQAGKVSLSTYLRGGIRQAYFHLISQQGMEMTELYYFISPIIIMDAPRDRPGYHSKI